MLKSVFFVGLGGAIGTILRYITQKVVGAYIPINFPLGTFFANMLGCFLIGVISGLLLKYGASFNLKLFLVTGVCGGYTTLSSFTFETMTHLHRGEYMIGFSYVLLSLIIGLILCFLGFALSK